MSVAFNPYEKEIAKSAAAMSEQRHARLEGCRLCSEAISAKIHVPESNGRPYGVPFFIIPAVYVRDPATGRLFAYHQTCTKRQSRKERRACASCGFVRVVIVRSKFVDGAFEDEHVEHCDACQLDLRAASHEEQARRFRERSRAIRAKRVKP